LQKRVSAFTLIELLVVLSMLSILMLIVTPRFASIINPERAKNFVLRLQGSLQYLSEKAILEQGIYLFNFDLDERRYYFTQLGVEEGEGGTSLPGGSSGRDSLRSGDEDLGVEVQDRHLRPAQVPEKLEIARVRVVPGGEVASGRVTLPFTPNGMMFSFEMVFTVQDGRRYLVTGNSYSNRIRIFSANPEEEEEWRLLE
jgi:prepilin-type N-terminal cleavage/methylation domain-containing protein